MTEKEARDEGYEIQVATMKAEGIPKAHILKQTTGLIKMIVDKKTDHILGAHMFCAESHEVINVVKRAMDEKLTYQVLRDAIYTHPTMTELLNEAFNF